MVDLDKDKIMEAILLIKKKNLIVDVSESSRLDPNDNRDNNLDELAKSINDLGLISPITVSKISNQKYLLVHGYRRYFAIKRLGHKTFPCIILK